MIKFISILLSVVFVGIIVVLSLFSCILASKSDEYWESIKKEMEKRK